MSLVTEEHTQRIDHAVRLALETSLGLTKPLNTNIHPADQMFNFITSTRGSGSVAQSEYFTSGVQLLKVLEQLVQWKFGSFDNVGSLLDFASGYGRLTRFLVHRMPPDRIWVSDIQADAVSFQQSEFGVQGFVSTPDPADLPCERTFDFIFVASLFSHLPDATFRAWLKKLHSLLSPGGLLVFSANDERMLPASVTMTDSGIVFGGGGEVPSLDDSNYGNTVVTETYVREAIRAATGRPEYLRILYGMFYVQDLYLVAADPGQDFSGLSFSHLPHGSVDYALWREEGELLVRGWAVDFSDESTGPTVRLYAGDELLHEGTTSILRPDVHAQYKADAFMRSGWECSLRMAEDSPMQPLLVKAVSTNGNEAFLYVGDVLSVTPRGKVESCRWTGPDELHVVGWALDPLRSGSPVKVQILVDGTFGQECLTEVPRPDVQQYFNDAGFATAGWECTVHVPEFDPSVILAVRSISGSGLESTLYVGGITPLELQSHSTAETWRDVLASRLQDIRHLEGEIALKNAALQEYTKRIQHLEGEIARKNAALARLEAHTRRWPWQRRG
jgi:SAM-dependent methyltransferase